MYVIKFRLSDRKAINGLISIAIEDNKAVLVEVNCETDFVARSEIFKSLESFVLAILYQFNTPLH